MPTFNDHDCLSSMSPSRWHCQFTKNFSSDWFVFSPGYRELKVMNNYFGIGLDAKIALDFHNKREEVPDKVKLIIHSKK